MQPTNNNSAQIELDALLAELINSQLPTHTNVTTNNENDTGSPIVTASSSSCDSLSAKAFLQILKSLKSLQGDMASLQASVTHANNEIAQLQQKLQDSNELINTQQTAIEDLRATNETLLKKNNDLEARQKSNKILLSGPLIDIDNNLTPRQLRDQAIQNIKTVYNHDIAPSVIQNCERLRGTTKQKDRLILSFSNDFSKSDLISKVIQTDKSNGVNLNINEYLSAHNANLLYQLRMLRKSNKNAISSCFSRNGRIYYKAQKESKPKLIVDVSEIEKLKDELRQHGALLRRPTAPDAHRPNTRSNQRKTNMQMGYQHNYPPLPQANAGN